MIIDILFINASKKIKIKEKNKEKRKSEKKCTSFLILTLLWREPEVGPVVDHDDVALGERDDVGGLDWGEGGRGPRSDGRLPVGRVRVGAAALVAGGRWRRLPRRHHCRGCGRGDLHGVVVALGESEDRVLVRLVRDPLENDPAALERPLIRRGDDIVERSSRVVGVEREHLEPEVAPQVVQGLDIHQLAHGPQVCHDVCFARKGRMSGGGRGGGLL